MFPDFTPASMAVSVDTALLKDREAAWLAELSREAQQRKATAAATRSLGPRETEDLARQVFTDIAARALNEGVDLSSRQNELVLRLIGELSGLGQLLELIAAPDVEDIAVNMGHLYVYRTKDGWVYMGPAASNLASGLRVLIDRAGQRAPTPEYPIADAMLQVMVPGPEGSVTRKGIRINFIMPPACPYGEIITLRIASYRRPGEIRRGESLSVLCDRRLPPVKRPEFNTIPFPAGSGVLSPQSANYLLAVMVHGGTLILSGATGSGKTFIAQKILQEMLTFFAPGAIRLFIVEDSNEIVLNGWDGNALTDTQNIIYTVTRPEAKGGPPPITTYDLIRAALRSRPHGVVIGEARGAEAWELIRAAATGHGYSAFTIHATGAEHVWPRFLQVVRSHPDAALLGDFQIAQSFAEAVTAVVHVERSARHGQVVREIAEVYPVVEQVAARPAFNFLFKLDPEQSRLVATGNRPSRMGFRSQEIGIPESYFERGR
jgi:pilus assembly protein CpaF